MTEFIYKNLRYPKAALGDRIEGTVLVEIEINHKGAVTDTKVKQSLGKDFDLEACRVAKMLKFDVAKARGVRITFHKKIKITFKAPRQKTPASSPQVQYVVTPVKKEAKPKEPAKAKSKTINYTIKF